MLSIDFQKSIDLTFKKRKLKLFCVCANNLQFKNTNNYQPTTNNQNLKPPPAAWKTLHTSPPPPATTAFAQTQDWRGFWIQRNRSGILGITEQTHDSIQQNLVLVTRAQTLRGGININSIGGGWDGMQSASGAPSTSPKQTPGCNVSNATASNWYGTSNLTLPGHSATTPIVSRLTKIPECAPDFNHWNDWYSYVRSIVERYDGDGDSDMTGLTKPVRFYIMEQEIYYSGAANNIAGDSGEAAGYGYWEDNVQNLIRLREVTYQAIHDADPSGQTKLVGSGGAPAFRPYGDFPDYPNTNGDYNFSYQRQQPHARVHAHGWDSLAQMLTLLGTDTPFKMWLHRMAPAHQLEINRSMHATIHEYARETNLHRRHVVEYPTSIFPTMVSAQFIGGDSLEGDFPNSTVVSYNALYNGLENHDSTVINWYNAKGARDAVKCFALCVRWRRGRGRSFR